MPDKKDNRIRPMQVVPMSQKTQQWYEDNANHFIRNSGFNLGHKLTADSMTRDHSLQLLYDVYNSQFPTNWFDHITNPLGTNDASLKSYPAKIRPFSILRTNIDLLLGEYTRRPFSYNVENLGESGFTNKVNELNEEVKTNITQHFIQAAIQQMADDGRQLTAEELQKLRANPPLPQEVKNEFESGYKDAIAAKANRWLRRKIRDKKIRTLLLKMFKDWLIAGECVSFKTVRHDELVYERVPVKDVSGSDMGDDMLEDGEWVVVRRYLTASDIVDNWWEELSKKDLKQLVGDLYGSSKEGFFSWVSQYNITTDTEMRGDRIPVYHVQWKGKKKHGISRYIDPETWMIVEKEVDEGYEPDPELHEQVEWYWINEVYEATGINGQIWVECRAVPVQRNVANNVSKCKLSYNRRRYSNTHSRNISVLEIGIPFQIMYIIVNYILEKTIGKNKGKIALIDKNAIPDDEDWDETTFLYYADAQGFGLLNRSNPDVDRTWNQYTVLDLSLFNEIKELIALRDSIKAEWDDIIGITRQRKGQTYAADGQGVNERALFQSTVITDMIFLGFEEFVEAELQGIIEYMKFLTARGEKSAYNDDDYGITLMEIFPEDFAMEDLGVFVDRSGDTLDKLRKMESYAQAMIQNNYSPSAVLEVIDSVNIAELKRKLRNIETMMGERERENAANEQQANAAVEELRKEFMAYEKMLERENTDAEYDRKEDIEHIKGGYSTFTFQDGDSNDNGVPDITEVQKLLQGQQKIDNDRSKSKAERAERDAEQVRKRIELEHKIDMDLKNFKELQRKNTATIRQTDKKLKIDAKKAAQRPRASSK